MAYPGAMHISKTLPQALCLLLSIGASINPALAEQVPATIAVVGHASITRAPDVAIITAEIITNNPNATRAAAANDVIQDKVQTELAALELPTDAAHTISYRSNYIAPAKSPEVQERSGFVVVRTIEVETKPALIDRVTRALTQAGVDTIDDVRSDLRDRDGVYRTLFIQALNDAESQAHTIATAAKVKIVRVRSIDASTLRPASPGIAFAEMTMKTIPLQNQVISTGLNVIYEVEPFPLPGYLRRVPLSSKTSH